MREGTKPVTKTLYEIYGKILKKEDEKMGNSASSYLVYGVYFEDASELPWYDEEADKEIDVEDWWLNVNGYVPIHKPFTEDGHYAPGWTQHDPRFEEYFDQKRKFLESHPMPFDIEYGGSYDESVTVLCVPDVGVFGNWGEPAKVDISSLTIPEQKLKDFLDFFEKFGLDSDGHGWLLVSFYG